MTPKSNKSAPRGRHLKWTDLIPWKRGRKQQVEMVLESGLYDETWYLSHYPEVAGTGIDPLSHYLAHGAYEGRDPSPLFDTMWYLSCNKDVAAAGANPLLHFLLFGAAEGRDPNPLFDTDWYLSQYPDVAAAGMNPLSHYLRYGAAEGRDPNPLFDTDWYLSQYPDVAATGGNPLDHYLRWGAAERRNPGPHFQTAWYLTKYPDVAAAGMNPLAHHLREAQKKRKVVIDASEKVRWAEPILQQISLDQLSVIRVDTPKLGMPPYFSAFRKLFLSLERSYEHIVFIPCLTCGGADLEAIHALRATQERHGVNSVLLVVTDHDLVPAKHRLPAGTHLRVLSAYDPDLSPEARMMIVRTLIQSLQPKAILNMDSRACWEVFVRFGAPLSHSIDLYVMLFCHDYRPDGRVGGYAIECFRDCLPHLKKIYANNAAFLCALKKRFGVPPMYFPKLSTLYQPWKTTPLPADCKAFPPPPEDGAFRVFWAGRICQQRNPRLLLEIARRCPGYTFDVYGTCDKMFEEVMSKEAPANVNLKGPYSTLAAIPAGCYNAFLYTSLWDDLPNALITAGVLEVPVVASGLDGIVELIDETTGWPIRDYEAAKGYVEALEGIKSNPSLAKEKVLALHHRIATRHSWESYIAALSQSPSFID